jgi:hypothetical protein
MYVIQDGCNVSARAQEVHVRGNPELRRERLKIIAEFTISDDHQMEIGVGTQYQSRGFQQHLVVFHGVQTGYYDTDDGGAGEAWQCGFQGSGTLIGDAVVNYEQLVI